MKTTGQPAVLSTSTTTLETQQWKMGGGRVIGFFCSYVPEELIHAAGVMPYRVRARGCGETPLADALLAQVNCSFAKGCLELALEGKYEFLDGLVAMNSCDHMRRMYDVWRHRLPVPYLHFLSVPRKDTPQAVLWYRNELALFKASLESHFQTTVGEEHLRISIGVYNRTRELLRRLYQMRSCSVPMISGTEAHEIAAAATAMPRERYNDLLESTLKQVEERTPIGPRGARMMIMGSALDDPSLIQEVEEAGGMVVADALCFGARYCGETVQEGADPLEALAVSYLRRPACPRMVDEHAARSHDVLSMVRELAVDGVIMQRIRYCDLWGGATMLLQKDLETAGVPLLVLDREYTLSGVGQVRTRVQAFLEMIGN